MPPIQLTDILIITIVALIVFGPSRLPDLSRSVGKAIFEFKQGINEANQEANKAINQATEPPDEPK